MPINAHAMTGLDLYNMCKSNDKMDSTACLIYITGYREGAIFGAVDVTQKLGKTPEDVKDKRVFCIPDNAPNGQIQLIFNRYSENHPEELNANAGVVLTQAVRNGFCKK